MRRGIIRRVAIERGYQPRDKKRKMVENDNRKRDNRRIKTLESGIKGRK